MKIYVLPKLQFHIWKPQLFTLVKPGVTSGQSSVQSIISCETVVINSFFLLDRHHYLLFNDLHTSFTQLLRWEERELARPCCAESDTSFLGVGCHLQHQVCS